MSMQWPQRLAAGAACALVLSFATAGPAADSITLNSGTVVHGHLVASGNSKTVALTTTTGSLLIFERQEVKSVSHGAASPQKASPPKAATVKRVAKPQFTPAEAAWMPKVRTLVEQAFGPDRNQSRRAVTALLNIDDENAISALARYLADNSNDEARQLYIKVLRNIPGPKSVYCLVAHSLYDRSPKVRETARKAVALQASLARPYYIQALKSRDPGLASLAAKAIVEIGDPNGETVPYLIDTLSFQTLREVVTSKTIQPLDGARLAEIVFQRQDFAQTEAALNAPPVKITIRPGPAPGSSGDDRMGMGGSAGGNPKIYHLEPMGPIDPPMFNDHRPLNKSGGASTVTVPVTLGDILNTPVQYQTGLAAEKNVNPAVYDALVQVTGQQLGGNVNNWRRWWSNQVKNRTLQNSKPAKPQEPKTPANPPASNKPSGTPDVRRSRS